MPADFTYGMYATLLEAGLDRDLPFLTVSRYLSADSLPERFAVLRHDVDRKPRNALDFARIEADRGISSTYYFRTVEATFDPEVIEAIEALGHEVGYHYEDLDRAEGDVDAAHDSFRSHLERLRRHATVETSCMHGNPLSPYDNRDMWERGPGFEEYGLHGEAYLSMDFADVAYYSDTGRTWRDGALKVKDHTVGDDRKERQAETTPELIGLIQSGDPGRLCLLTHPDRWAGSRLEYVSEAALDTAKNVAKYVLYAVSR